MPASAMTKKSSLRRTSRRFSTSNSISSSSVDTVVRRAESPSRLRESRPLSGLFRVRSSQALSKDSSTTIKHAPSSPSRRKRRLSISDGSANNLLEVKEVVGNLHRWSQSTVSSGTSTTNNRRTSTSARMSFGGASPHRTTAASGRPTSPAGHPFDANDHGSPATTQPYSLPVRPPRTYTPSLQPPQEPNGRARPLTPSGQGVRVGDGLPPPLIVPTFPSSSSSNELSSTVTTPGAPSPYHLTPSSTITTDAEYFAPDREGQSPQRGDLSTRPSWQDLTASSGSSPVRTPGLGSGPFDSPEQGAANRARRNIARTTIATEAEHERGRVRGPVRPPELSARVVGHGISNGSSSPRRRRHRDPDGDMRQASQKAMLAKALQQANTAVLLDNAHNFEGAIESYGDACSLLAQAMGRSSGEEDRRKLDAIRRTYTNRINELRTIPLQDDTTGKALPARPESAGPGSRDSSHSLLSVSDESVKIETATLTRIGNDQSQSPVSTRSSQLENPRIRTPTQPPFEEATRLAPLTSSITSQSIETSTPQAVETTTWTSQLALPENAHVPRPLSPRRPSSPVTLQSEPPEHPVPIQSSLDPDRLQPPPRKEHSRANSTESISWLDTIEESGGSSASSVHSRSSFGLRRKRIRAGSGATEAEFEAALDAAVEAAYDDGFEPVDVEDHCEMDDVPDAPRSHSLNEEVAREAEREAAIHLVREKGETHFLSMASRGSMEKLGVDYSDAELEEDERLLDEVTRGFSMDDFEFDLQIKSALPPRQSDSSGFSGRTGSSVGSNPTTAGTSLQTLAEAPILPALPKELQSRSPPPPINPPPSAALPTPPTVHSTTIPPLPPLGPPPRPPSLVDPLVQSVRIRRLSGQAHQPLRIDIAEATVRDPANLGPSVSNRKIIAPEAGALLPPLDFSSVKPDRQPDTSSFVDPGSTLGLQGNSQMVSSPYIGPSPSRSTPDTPGLVPGLSRVLTQESDGAGSSASRAGSPVQSAGKFLAEHGLVRKNLSSSSLKNRNLSISSPDESDVSPSTPTTLAFSAGPSGLRQGSIPSIPALPLSGVGPGSIGVVPLGGLHLFESNIHLSKRPEQEGELVRDLPAPLEPCPTAHILRPFWLMRCLYQTIAHPRGGYLSTKLFVPRDVWHVKGVKIKGLEEKISNCDLLTAALLKLGKVDTYDADAVLEEMQSFETILEQVQTALTKKLGNEVGPQGLTILAREHVAGSEQSITTEVAPSKHTTSSNKSYLSWKRLRPKNSGAGLMTTLTAPRDTSKEGPNLSTVPMASTLAIRGPNRDLGQAQFAGPNAVYMSALARLFDAVQVLDQLGRQVEDPGLKYSSSTYVGMELSARHAAEFFAFYVCRFALTDVTAMLDKYIKRSSEWVLA